jgi:GMP synthase (glutamine-hydrolysing)
MRIHCLLHAPHEGLGTIKLWAKAKGYIITKTCLYNNEQLSLIKDFDLLVIMGGPMSVNDENVYPWLKKEKEFIEFAILKEKAVVGFCLGSQLIANVLGSKIYKNKYKEIGWFDITFTKNSNVINAFNGFPAILKVFQWHQETFDIPKNCIHIANSEYCENQAFSYGKNIIAIQFHLEVTKKDVQNWIKTGRNEITKDKYVQTEQEMLREDRLFDIIKKYNFLLFDNLSRNIKNKKD